MLLTLYICFVIVACNNEWPEEYPELDTDILQDELCPWDLTKQCYIFSKDKEINHPVLNGIIDCDHKSLDKDTTIISRHYGKRLYKYASCEIDDIVRILCKPIPEDKDKLKQYILNSRFLFIPQMPIKSARSAKSGLDLANRLATTRATFEIIDGSFEKISEFESIPKDFQSWMDYFYSNMYVTGSSWGMNVNEYKEIDNILTLFIGNNIAGIIEDAKILWNKAFKCSYIKCEPTNNQNILYYDQINEYIKLRISMDNSCLNKDFACNQKKFYEKQSIIRTWTPANKAFVELESAFKIKYPNYFIKNINPISIPNQYEPKILSLNTKKYINKGMEIKDSSIIIPYEFKLPSKYQLLENSDNKKRGYISDPLEKLSEKQRIKFQGELTTTSIFYIKLNDESSLQIKKEINNNENIISPILPPLSQIDITWILYNWRFCWIKDFGCDKSLKFYIQPPDLILFDKLSQNSNTGLFDITPYTLLQNKFRMPEYTELRLYPLCGDSIGKTDDNRDPCEYVYFYDALRINDNQIQQWDGIKYSPQIEDEYKYLLLKPNKYKLSLGIIANPLLGKNGSITINFDIETNDWKNIYILPPKSEIKTNQLFSDENNSPIILIPPSLISKKSSHNPIAMGTKHCFNIKLKSNSNSKLATLQFKDEIYFRPIIFPTEITIKRWKKTGYNIENVCTDGFILLTENNNKKKLDIPGLMKFSFKDKNNDNIEYGSFCIYFKLYGTFNIFYEIGSKNWYARDNLLISYNKQLKALISGYQDGAMSNKQLDKLKEIDINKCYTNKDGYYSKNNNYFNENSYLKTRFKLCSSCGKVLKVEKPGAVSFEIRKFPEPLKIGETTEWITIHCSRLPFYGDFILQPVCKNEPKLKYEFENAESFYELESINSANNNLESIDNDQNNNNNNNNLEPFSFKFKITAPKHLQCYGHYPYRIDWKVKSVVVNEQNDDINPPPAIFLMVIQNDFESFDIIDTGTKEIIESQNKDQSNIYEDGLADPKCVEKYSQRKQDEEDTGIGGPNAQLAAPLNLMGKKLESSYMAEGGDNYNVDEYSKPVTVSETIRNPAQLAEYLKDYDRLKQFICDKQPSHKVCDGDNQDNEMQNEKIPTPTINPTIPTPPPLPFWSWQNIVVYIGCLIVFYGLLKSIGCFEKSLEKRIIEAQIKAMEPVNTFPNDDNE